MLLAIGVGAWKTSPSRSLSKSEADLLLTENIEALSVGGEGKDCTLRIMPCYSSTGNECGSSSRKDLEKCCYTSYCR